MQPDVCSSPAVQSQAKSSLLSLLLPGRASAPASAAPGAPHGRISDPPRDVSAAPARPFNLQQLSQLAQALRLAAPCLSPSHEPQRQALAATVGREANTQLLALLQQQRQQQHAGEGPPDDGGPVSPPLLSLPEAGWLTQLLWGLAGVGQEGAGGAGGAGGGGLGGGVGGGAGGGAAGAAGAAGALLLDTAAALLAPHAPHLPLQVRGCVCVCVLSFASAGAAVSGRRLECVAGGRARLLGGLSKVMVEVLGPCCFPR